MLYLTEQMNTRTCTHKSAADRVTRTLNTSAQTFSCEQLPSLSCQLHIQASLPPKCLLVLALRQDLIKVRMLYLEVYFCLYYLEHTSPIPFATASLSGTFPAMLHSYHHASCSKKLLRETAAGSSGHLSIFTSHPSSRY